MTYLLLSIEGWTDQENTNILPVSQPSMLSVYQRFILLALKCYSNNFQ